MATGTAAENRAGDAFAGMSGRFGVGMGTVPEVVGVRMDNESPAPEVAGLHTLKCIGPRVSGTSDIAEVAGVSGASAARGAAMMRRRPFVVMIAGPVAPLAPQVTRTVYMESMAPLGQRRETDTKSNAPSCGRGHRLAFHTAGFEYSNGVHSVGYSGFIRQIGSGPLPEGRRLPRSHQAIPQRIGRVR